MSVYSRNICIKKWSSENRRMVITIQAGKLAQAAHRNNRAMMKSVRIKICKPIHRDELMANFSRVYCQA